MKGGLTGLKDKAKQALGGGGGGGGGKGTKATNIVEEIDIGVPISVAYNQWTQFQEFSGFMKKVDSVEQKDEEKVDFKAKIFWSHRTWEATILKQVPEEQIVWRSRGEGPRGRRSHVPQARSRPDPDPRRPGVLPPGPVRADREHLACSGAWARGAEAFPATRDDHRSSWSRTSSRDGGARSTTRRSPGDEDVDEEEEQ